MDATEEGTHGTWRGEIEVRDVICEKKHMKIRRQQDEELRRQQKVDNGMKRALGGRRRGERWMRGR